VPSLHNALVDFLDRWKANIEMSGKAGVGEGVCDLCQEERYVQYNIQVDASFCSSRCAKRYNDIVKMAMTYVQS
jgi:hypothetical protein